MSLTRLPAATTLTIAFLLAPHHASAGLFNNFLRNLGAGSSEGYHARNGCCPTFVTNGGYGTSYAAGQTYSGVMTVPHHGTYEHMTPPEPTVDPRYYSPDEPPAETQLPPHPTPPPLDVDHQNDSQATRVAPPAPRYVYAAHSGHLAARPPARPPAASPSYQQQGPIYVPQSAAPAPTQHTPSRPATTTPQPAANAVPTAPPNSIEAAYQRALGINVPIIE